MAVTKAEIRSGAYYDSAFLMQLQRSLTDLPGVDDAGVIMGTDTNKELLARIDLLPAEAKAAKPDDLVIVIRGDTEKSVDEGLARVDDLLTRRRTTLEQKLLPKSLESALSVLPDAGWVLISVAGRYAGGVTRDALRLGKHVFLFSDNVSVEEEIELKKIAAGKGLLVMGPDCGTANVLGIGLGFANKVRLGPIGVVAAAGTGLQQVTARIHQLGGGVTYGIGTGGRDLSAKVGAATFKQGIDVLSRDPDTKVIVLISKPPEPKVADEVLAVARKAGKPVVVNFIGRSTSTWQMDNIYFAVSLDDAARLAVELAKKGVEVVDDSELKVERFAKGQRYLRGLFSGGTLAYEAQHILQSYVPMVWANAPLKKENKLADSLISQEHSIVDLGEDEFTVGRLHPMMDNELRIRRLYEEAKDPEVAVIMLDVVLGYGSHIDPASELAPAIARVRGEANKAGRYLEVMAVVTGTDEDPQNMANQIAQLKAAGALVETNNETMVRYVGRLIRHLNAAAEEPGTTGTPINLDTLKKPVAAINVGLESFAENLVAQGAQAVHVDWKPPAGGNEKLAAILARMRK
ncbi:MAG: acyl-CoA synthetase FdrA [Anaerolineaceae bacterium]|nr:acyl-CoA synthetase FdrA [Anaerolineaceae bacterium]